eukprot:2032433-Rhodomonas_salina.1
MGQRERTESAASFGSIQSSPKRQRKEERGKKTCERRKKTTQRKKKLRKKVGPCRGPVGVVAAGAADGHVLVTCQVQRER